MASGGGVAIRCDRVTDAVLSLVMHLRQASGATPIAILAGEASPLDRAAALEAGADAVLRGAEDPRVVTATLSALDRRQGHRRS